MPTSNHEPTTIEEDLDKAIQILGAPGDTTRTTQISDSATAREHQARMALDAKAGGAYLARAVQAMSDDRERVNHILLELQRRPSSSKTDPGARPPGSITRAEFDALSARVTQERTHRITQGQLLLGLIAVCAPLVLYSAGRLMWWGLSAVFSWVP